MRDTSEIKFELISDCFYTTLLSYREIEIILFLLLQVFLILKNIFSLLSQKLYRDLHATQRSFMVISLFNGIQNTLKIILSKLQKQTILLKDLHSA